MRIKLRHYSGLLGAEGKPGQIIDCPDDIARLFIDTCRAELIGESVAPAAPAPIESEPVQRKRGRPRKIGSAE